MMQLQVSRQSIAYGKATHPRQCPIALALIDAGYRDVYTSVQVATARDCNGSRRVFLYSESARDFMSAVDAGAAVQPCTIGLTEVDVRGHHHSAG